MCINPLTIKDPSNPRRGMIVPCGHCLECKRKYQNEWMVRLDEHLKSSNFKAVFFTLTYADECIPKNYLVSGIVYRTYSDYAYDKISSTVCVDESTGDEIDLSKVDVKIIDFNKFDFRTLPEFYEDMLSRSLRDDEVVSFNSLRMKDVQDWNKRCRKVYQKHTKNKPPKYFISEEYGPHTFRPHYHGVMFGIDKKDFDQYFKKDWIKHFGRQSNAHVCVTSEDVNPSEGGIQYVTKYCSKGVFEHPFCSRDFYYFHKNSDGTNTHTEYHSKHYERCIEYFQVDQPLVDRPSKLISTGLGSSFLDKSQVMNYYAAGDDVNISEDIKFKLKELSSQAVKFLNLDSYEKDQEGNLYHRDEAHTQVPNIVYKDNHYYSKAYYFDGEELLHGTHCWEGTFYSDGVYNKLIDLKEKLKYNKNTDDKVFSYNLPKYYRTKMFTAEIQHLMSCVVSEEYVNLYQEKYRQLSTSNPDWSPMEISSYIDTQETSEREFRRKQMTDRIMDNYKKSSF